MPINGGGILDRLRGLYTARETTQPSQDRIPRGAQIDGPGPSFVDDSRPAPTTIAGDPWSPIIGKTQETHQQIGIESLRYGNPRPIPWEADRYWRERDADDAQRHSGQRFDGNGWDTPVAMHPDIQRPVRPLSVRPTSYSHPELDSQLVTGEVNAHQPYNLNGAHFSMADHRRDYRIYEQTPVRTRRSTWRLEPQPWDLDLVDMPETEPVNPTGVEAPQGIMAGRSYRLGG